MHTALNLLLVEPHHSTQFEIQPLLNSIASTQYELTTIKDLAEFTTLLEENHYDVCLLNQTQLTPTDAEALHNIANQKSIPLIILSENKQSAPIHTPDKISIRDYLKLTEITPQLLERSIRYAVEQQQITEELTKLVKNDYLTGLLNRAFFENNLKKIVNRNQRNQQHMALLYLDLDHFKSINDNLGHGIGDKLLKEIANRLLKILRVNDLATRLGGDEFSVILDQITQPQDAALVAKKIISAISEPVIIDQHELHTSASVGIAVFPTDGDTPEKLTKNADMAMYAAKKNGRNQYQHFLPELQKAAERYLLLDQEVRQAIAKKELSLHYQPQINLTDGAIISLEALLRWTHPTLGPIPTDELIQLAENTGTIFDIGDWVVEQACQQFSAWGLTSQKLCLNLSTKQFVQDDTAKKLLSLLKKFKLPARQLVVEIHENTLMKDPDKIQKTLETLSHAGVMVAIDDFGTGYSSLQYLKKLPIHILKIDRTFVSDINIDDNNTIIVRSTVHLAHELGLTTTAEGVETEEQKQFLKTHGCDAIQGYLISKPLDSKQTTQLLENHNIVTSKKAN